MQTRDYKDLNGHACSSPYYKLGARPSSGGLPNNLAYYVEGTKDHVSKVYLVLNVKQPSEATSAQDTSACYAAELVKRALGAPLPNPATQQIHAGKPGTWKLAGSVIEVTRDDWPTKKGYSLHFVIR
jgi:hypothetical protein